MATKKQGKKDQVKLTQEQKAVADHIARRLLEAQQDVLKWQAEQQRSIQEFAFELKINPRENWNYKDGQFTKMAEEEPKEVK